MIRSMLTALTATAALLAFAPGAFSAPSFDANAKLNYSGTDPQGHACSLTVTTDDQGRVYLVDGHFAPQSSNNGAITLYFDYNTLNGLPVTTPLDDGFTVSSTRLADGALATMSISFHGASGPALTSIDASSSWVGIFSTHLSCDKLRQH